MVDVHSIKAQLTNLNKRTWNDGSSFFRYKCFIFIQYLCCYHYLRNGWTRDGLFFEFASLLLIMLLGHWIEMKAIGEAGDDKRHWLSWYQKMLTLC